MTEESSGSGTVSQADQNNVVKLMMIAEDFFLRDLLDLRRANKQIQNLYHQRILAGDSLSDPVMVREVFKEGVKLYEIPISEQSIDAFMAKLREMKWMGWEPLEGDPLLLYMAQRSNTPDSVTQSQVVPEAKQKSWHQIGFRDLSQKTRNGIWWNTLSASVLIAAVLIYVNLPQRGQVNQVITQHTQPESIAGKPSVSRPATLDDLNRVATNLAEPIINIEKRLDKEIASVKTRVDVLETTVKKTPAPVSRTTRVVVPAAAKPVTRKSTGGRVPLCTGRVSWSVDRNGQRIFTVPPTCR